jgi:hypothetical protein
MRCAAAALAVALIAVVAGATAPGSPAAGTCARRGALPFLDAVGSRCPFVRIEPSPPLEVGPPPTRRLSPVAASCCQTRYMSQQELVATRDALFLFLICRRHTDIYDLRTKPVAGRYQRRQRKDAVIFLFG